MWSVSFQFGPRTICNLESGLVDGRKLFCDSSLVEADASCNSVVDSRGIKSYLNPAYRELEARLEEREENENKDDDSQGRSPRRYFVNARYVSTTDPEASVVRKGQGKADLRYQTHRGIDGAYGVITATVVGRGDENEAHRLGDLLQDYAIHTPRSAEVVVADSKYGTTANFLDCYDRGVLAHIPVLKQTQDQRARRRKIFPESLFLYDPQTDTRSAVWATARKDATPITRRDDCRCSGRLAVDGASSFGYILAYGRTGSRSPFTRSQRCLQSFRDGAAGARARNDLGREGLR
jgi:DDE family transposase